MQPGPEKGHAIDIRPGQIARPFLLSIINDRIQ
jgi:hypothetical protein